MAGVAATVAAIALTAGKSTPGGSHRAPPASRAGAHPARDDVSSRPARPPSGPAHAASDTSGTTPSSSAAGPAGGPVPAGFSPESFTAIGDLTWWLLGTAPCAQAPCTSIVRTEDGGQTFVGIPAPRTDGVSELRFANAQDGFAFDPQLWVTHDGGASWQPVSLGGEVIDLAASGGYVYAIVSTSGGRGMLMRSPVNTNSWSALSAAGEVFAGEGLWAQDSTVLAQRANAGAVSGMLVSDDDGQSFADEPLPPAVACELQEPSPPVIWEHCSTGMLSGVWRSADGGASYQAASDQGSGLPVMPNSAAFAAASATVAVIGSSAQPNGGAATLYRTDDGGRSWEAVAGAPRLLWSYLGFTDPTHGVAIGRPQNGSGPAEVYYTTDGGLSYHPVAIG